MKFEIEIHIMWKKPKKHTSFVFMSDWLDQVEEKDG